MSNDFANDYNIALKSINSELAEKRAQVKLVKQFSTMYEEIQSGSKKLTEKDYHKLCETTLRKTDMLGSAVCFMIEDLEYLSKSSNCFNYKLGNYKLSIPSYSELGVDLYIDDIDDNLTYTDFIRYKFKRQIDSYNHAIDYREMYLAMNGFFKKASFYCRRSPKFMRPVLYVIKDIEHRFKDGKSIDVIMKEQLDESILNKNNLMQNIRHKYVAFHENQANINKYLDKYLPILFEWTDTVRIRKNDCIVRTYTKGN